MSDAGGEAGGQVLVLGGEAGGQVSVSAGQVTEAELQPSASYHHATYGGHHHEPDEYHGGHHSQARASNDPKIEVNRAFSLMKAPIPLSHLTHTIKTLC